MSSSDSTSSKSTTTKTKNLNLQGIEGVALGGDGSITITDGGAVTAMRDSVKEGFKLSGDTVETVAQFTTKALESQRRAQADALGFAERAGEQAMSFAYDAGRPEAAVMTDASKNTMLMVGAVAFALAAPAVVKAMK